MITISITLDAFAAIASTLPKGFTAQGRPDGKGGYRWSSSLCSALSPAVRSATPKQTKATVNRATNST
jgi:hypothetical protein